MTESEPKKESPVLVEAPAPPPVQPTAPAVVVEAESARSTRDVLLIIGAIGAVVGNVVVLAGGIYFNAKIEASKEQAAQVAVDADKKLDVIHEQTNSNLTGVNERLERAYTKIETLEKLLKTEEDPEEKKP